jgi:hypothetical protein
MRFSDLVSRRTIVPQEESVRQDRRSVLNFEDHLECSALAGFAFDLGISAVELGDVLDDGQAQPCSAQIARTTFVHPVEAFENPRLVLGSMPTPVSRTVMATMPSSGGQSGYRLSRPAGCTDRVVDKVDQDLLDAVRIRIEGSESALSSTTIEIRAFEAASSRSTATASTRVAGRRSGCGNPGAILYFDKVRISWISLCSRSASMSIKAGNGQHLGFWAAPALRVSTQAPDRCERGFQLWVTFATKSLRSF